MIKASHHGSIEVVKVLLDAGANIESKDKNGCTPLIHGIFFYNWFILNYIIFA